MKPIFYIVLFPEDNSVAVVPSNWLLDNNTKSHWPNTDDSTLVKLVKKAVDPLVYQRVEWEVFDCKIRCGSDSYEKARAGLERAVAESEVELTETEGQGSSEGRKLRTRSNKSRKNPRTVVSETILSPPCDPVIHQDNPNPEFLFDIQDVPNIFAEQTEGDEVHFVIQNENISDARDDNDLLSQSASSSLVLENANMPSVADSRITELIQSFHSLTKEVRDFQKTVLRQLVNIASDVSELMRITTQNNAAALSDELEIPGVTLPINVASEFDLLDDWLSNRENRLSFVCFLKGIGGANLENFVKRILVRTIGNDLANAANFTGKRDKLKFHGHLIVQCIIAAVRKNPEDTEPTEREVENIIAKWLLGSGDRNGGRAERQKRKDAQQGQL